MTETERIRLEKDILYEHHKAEQDFSAQVVKLKRAQGQLQHAAEKLKTFVTYVETAPTLRREGGPSATMPELDIKQIESECDELAALREKVDQLSADKKGLGL
jgi:hypothetical protein